MSGLSDDEGYHHHHPDDSLNSRTTTDSELGGDGASATGGGTWNNVAAAEGACFVGQPGEGTLTLPPEEDEDEKKDLASQLPSCDNLLNTFLVMPLLIREHIYQHLSQRDHLRLRHVCSQVSEEIDNFVDFTVTFRKPLTRSFVPIPFPHLKFLTIDNSNEDLPWNWVHPRSSVEEDDDNDSTRACSGPGAPAAAAGRRGEVNGPLGTHQHHGPRASTRLAQNCYSSAEDEFIYEGTISGLKLMSITETTLQKLAFCRSIKGAIIATDVFEKKIPELHWVNLTYLRLHFYIVRFVGSHELEMLENFDSLCKQTFPQLNSLKICLRRSYLNPQSSFSIRALRFMSKHWRTLRDMTIEMEAEKCDLYPQTLTPEFTEEELENLGKVQLKSLKIDATELLCRKCRIWQEFIKQQKSIENLKLSLYAAQGHPIFFYPVGRSPGATTMRTISVGLWGLHGHYPIDFRRLTNGLECVNNLRLFRSPSIIQDVNDGPELLNLTCIPAGLVSMTLKGFTIASQDIDIILENTPELNHLTLKNAGSNNNNNNNSDSPPVLSMGMAIRHVKMLQSHPSLATACVDINNPVACPDQSYELFMREMEHSNRMEHKVIGSRDRLHTLLLIDRERTSALMRLKDKLHDDDVLPGLDYPTGFINRFDNWKIRS